MKQSFSEGKIKWRDARIAGCIRSGYVSGDEDRETDR
jgi:hypothetical protein